MQSPHILHVAAARGDSCWSHEKAPPHPARGCQRASRPGHPVRLLRRNDHRSDPDLRGGNHPGPRPRAPFPQSARYIADMKAADGKTMTIGISVDGADDRRVRLQRHRRRSVVLRQPGRRQDRHQVPVQATPSRRSSTAPMSEGDLTMNGVAYKFTAAPVPARPACTPPISRVCAHPGWCVRTAGRSASSSNGSISGRDFEQAELQQLNEQQFRNGVRNKRQLQQAAQIQILQNKSAKLHASTATT